MKLPLLLAALLLTLVLPASAQRLLWEVEVPAPAAVSFDNVRFSNDPSEDAVYDGVGGCAMVVRYRQANTVTALRVVWVARNRRVDAASIPLDEGCSFFRITPSALFTFHFKQSGDTVIRRYRRVRGALETTDTPISSADVAGSQDARKDPLGFFIATVTPEMKVFIRRYSN